MRIIASSFGLTIGVNTSILLAAAAGLLSPLAASVLHNGTTVGILPNILRRKVTVEKLKPEPMRRNRVKRPGISHQKLCRHGLLAQA